MKIFLHLLCMALCCPLWSQGTWKEQNKMPISRTQAMGFVLDGKGYLLGGVGETPDVSNEVWEWTPETDTWTQRANMPSERISGTAFSLGAKAYIFGGFSSDFYKDLLEWEPGTDTWIPKAVLPAEPRAHSSVFTIGNKAYFVGGLDSDYKNLTELWEWDQVTDTWTQRADPPESLFGVAAFAIGEKGYCFAGGLNIDYSDKLWEWDQATDTWTEKARMPEGRVGASAFAIGKRAYILGGEDYSSYRDDFWVWDQETDTWTEEALFPGGARARHVAFVLDGKGYILGGSNGPFGNFNDLWEWTPDIMNSVTDQPQKTYALKAFPNPSTDYCWIDCAVESGEKVTLNLFDSAGRLWHMEEHYLGPGQNRVALEMTKLPVGAYVAELQGAEWSQKILLEKY